jgi:hypothetical protein
VKQQTRFRKNKTTLIITGKSPVQLSIHLRIPYWVQGGSVKINGVPLSVFSSPSSWKPGDKIELSLPMQLHMDSMPDDETIQAAMYGPLVLAGRFGEMTRDMSYGPYGPKRGAQSKVPDIIADSGKAITWIEPDRTQSLTFKTVGQSQPMTLVPLYKVIHERYAVYWKIDRPST